MKKEHIWIEIGYQTFAYEGPQELRIERLAKSIQKNKSSFYHFFADVEVFTQRLLDFHLMQVYEMARKESKAKDETELAYIIVEHKLDLLFNRQLRFHRENPDFKSCFIKTNEISLAGFMPIWKEITGLNEHNYLANMVLLFSIENFFLQITNETLNETWIQTYFDSIREMIKQVKRTNSLPILNGSV